MDSEYKQCIIVRTDITLSRGKLAAQVAHAAVSAYELAEPRMRKAWKDEGQKKVVLKVSNQKELFELKDVARRRNFPTAIVTDAGLTEVPPGTTTALGIGPAKSEDLDELTGHLTLL